MSSEVQYEVNIQLQVENAGDLSEERLQTAVNWLLRTHDVEAGTGMSIVLSSDDDVRSLNQQFRGIDAPTDVLSFPDDASSDPEESQEPYLGDLILALPYIQRQAEAEQHSLSDELVLAVIHGTLHLLGYDHDTADNQTAMWRIQAKALQVMGVDIVVPLFDLNEE
jgi:probable rRNA maturation factor